MSVCKEIRSLLGRYVDGELGSADVSRVDNHLSVCEKCAEDVRLMEREAELLRGALTADEAPEHLCASLWQSLQERPVRVRWTPLRWAGLAAAAGLLIAISVGMFVSGRRPGAPLARVTACAGPLEIQHPGKDWAPLATYTMLRDGDRVRCGGADAGTLIVDADSRFDLDAGTSLVFLREAAGGSFEVKMQRGRIHARLPGLSRSLNILTPVANVVAAVERTEAAGPTEIEIALSGIPAELGLLGRVHILPAAHAAPDGPQLELLVYEGTVLLVKDSLATAVQSGHRIVVGIADPMPEPAAFDTAARRPWWPADLRAAVASRAPGPREPRELVRRGAGEPNDVLVTPRDAVIPGQRPGKAGAAATPRTDKVEGPPAPTGLIARPDIDAVLLTWKPVRYGKRPIVEYGIYRRAPGDTEFALIGRFPVIGENIQRYVFRDAGLGIGAEYQYAVAAAARTEDGGELVEGKLSDVATGSPADFHIYYTGGDNKELAIIVVEKLHGDKLRRQTFMVRERDPATGEAGRIGGPRRVEIEPAEGAKHVVLVDFSTGYHLADIITHTEHKDGIAKQYSGIVIENQLGERKTILRNGGP
ncbi:MAG: zf-HC2 domain-containing protein [Planctomycetota bacterium]